MPQRLVRILFFFFSSSSNFFAGIKNTALKSQSFFVEKVSRLCFPSILYILDRNQVARPHQSGSRPAIQPRPHPSSSRSSEPNMPYKLVGQKFFRINGVCEKNHQVRRNSHAFKVRLQLDYPTPPSDPRSRFPRDSQVKYLPVPQFTVN